MESNWKISDKWNWRGSYQYDTLLDKASLANSSLEFNPMKNNLIQLNYRYASKEYINQNLGASANRYQQDIKQVGVVRHGKSQIIGQLLENTIKILH